MTESDAGDRPPPPATAPINTGPGITTPGNTTPGTTTPGDTAPPPMEGVAFAAPEPEQPPLHPTAPVATRPAVRGRRRGPLTRMGPWAPVAGGLLGALLGLVAVLLLAGAADDYRERLSLVLLVVGMGLLGASGPLLADEVQLVRRGAREAVVRPASVEATAGLLNGLTPARLLLLVSGFVLFLAAYVSRG